MGEEKGRPPVSTYFLFVIGEKVVTKESANEESEGEMGSLIFGSSFLLRIYDTSTAERKDAFANEREKKILIFCSALKRPQRMLYFSQRPPHRISFLPHPIFSEEQKGFFLLLSHVSVRLCRSRGSRNAAASPPLPSLLPPKNRMQGRLSKKREKKGGGGS